MADHRTPIRKTPADVLDDLLGGHREALISGAQTAQKYLQKFGDRNDSLPNAVKFFVHDLLADAAYHAHDLEACSQAVAKAAAYLPAAKADMLPRFRDYLPSIRLFERGIALALDEGDFGHALALCDQALALGLGPVYAAKKASIERMM